MTVRAICNAKCRDQAPGSKTSRRLSSFAEVHPVLRRSSSNGTGYYIRLKCEDCDEIQWILFEGR